MTRQAIRIGGMTCGHCVGRVSAALKALPGVSVETVNVGSATVSYDEAAMGPSQVMRAIKDAGFDVLPAVPEGR